MRRDPVSASIMRPSGSCLRIFVSAIASKTRQLTSAATLPLSTASLNLEASLSRSCSTAATKCSLFRPTAFAKGPVAELVGIEGGVVSGVFNLESSGVEAPDRRPRHEEHYHEA